MKQPRQSECQFVARPGTAGLPRTGHGQGGPDRRSLTLDGLWLSIARPDTAITAIGELRGLHIFE
jgi:hypothetical protein